MKISNKHYYKQKFYRDLRKNLYNGAMKIIIKFLKLLSNIVDPNYWASKISKKTGLEDKARNSKFRKWEAGLTGWKHWAWQIGGGILFFIVFEYLINFIGLTMIPW